MDKRLEKFKCADCKAEFIRMLLKNGHCPKCGGIAYNIEPEEESGLLDRVFNDMREIFG